MSIQSLVRSSLVVASILSTGALAFARQPPALVDAQHQADEAVCNGFRLAGGTGYRDVAIRLGTHTDSSSAGTQAGGYRDVHARLGVSRANVAACTTPSRTIALATSR